MIIGLTGKKQSGKSTLANKLLALPALADYSQYALASPIKDIVNTLFNWGWDESEGRMKEVMVIAKFTVSSFNAAIKTALEYDLSRFSNGKYTNDTIVLALLEKFEGELVSPRTVYQWFGTDFARCEIDQDIWLKMIPKKGDLIITDIRFDNEAKYVERELGGYIVKVSNEDQIISKDTHPSESGVNEDLIHIDFVANKGFKRTTITLNYSCEDIEDIEGFLEEI